MGLQPAADGPEQEVEAEEAQPARVVKSPLEPTKAEIEERELMGHAVYRSWCKVCCAARATGQPHTTIKQEEEETAVPSILSDYAFMGEDDGKCMPILALKRKRPKRFV